MKKYRGWIIALLIVVLLAVAIVPLVINWLFKQVAPCEFMVAEWEASDALSYWGTILSFGGALALGAVTVYQTKKAHDQTEVANKLAQESLAQTERANRLAAQMQRLEQAKFVSMVTCVPYVHTAKEIALSQLENQYAPFIDETINLKDEAADSAQYYIIDGEVQNNSDYPIVQIGIHPGARGNGNCILYGLINYKTVAVYIPPHGQIKIRIAIPSDRLKAAKITDVSLSIDYTNIFDYKTLARLDIEKLCVQGKRCDATYRLAKFTDVRPHTEIDEDE